MCLMFYSNVLQDKIIASALFKTHTKVMLLEPRICGRLTQPLGIVGLRSEYEQKMMVNSNEKLTSKGSYSLLEEKNHENMDTNLLHRITKVKVMGFDAQC